jgi:diacylglycerol kinase
MRAFLASRARSFGFAFSGWGYILRTQPNTWIHSCATVLVLAFSAWLHLSARDWAVILLTISLVWMTEMVNTAAEALVDLASPGYSLTAKHVKDVCAGTVLLAAVASIVIGLLVLGPPLFARMHQMGIIH